MKIPGVPLNLTLLYGGTFDPVHSGHLAVLREVSSVLSPEKTHVVLSARPPHRNEPTASSGHRYAMLTTAFSGEPGVVLDTVEIDRIGPSYTVWTLRELSRQYSDSSLVMLVGADALPALSTWYHGWEILTLCHLVVFSRPGYSPEVPDSMRSCVIPDPLYLRLRRAGRIYIHEEREHDMAASTIRSRLQGSERDEVLASGLLPAGVGEYIVEHGLYDSAANQLNHQQESK